jgi:O-antigen/teichoic acid export membrane protein/SAM-dependent methyltransferase
MIKDTKFYFISSISSLFIAIFSLPIFTRLLSPSDFAILALFVLFGSLTSQIISLSLTEASRKFFFDDLNFVKINSTNFLAVIFIFILFGFIIFLLTDKISNYIFDNKISGNMVMISYLYGCIIWFYQYLNTLFIIQQKSFDYFLINFFSNIASPLLAVLILLNTELTYEARVIAMFSIFFISCFISFYLNRGLFKIEFDFKSIKKSFIFSIPLVPNSIVSQVHEATDKTMTNYFLGLNSLGILSIAVRIADISKLIINSFLQAWDPYFLKNVSKDLLNKKKILSRFYIILSVIFLSCFSVSLFSEEIIKVLTVKEYFFTIKYIPLICFSIFLVHIFTSLSVNQLIKTEKTGTFFKVSLISLFINVFLNLLLIPKFQIYGAIYATMISGIFSGAYSFFLGQKYFKIDIKFRRIIQLILIYIILNIPIYFFIVYELNWIIKLLLKLILLGAAITILIKLKFMRNSLFYSLKILVKKNLFMYKLFKKSLKLLFYPYDFFKYKILNFYLKNVSNVKRFDFIYKTNYWKSSFIGSRSGRGSDFETTEKIRVSLSNFIKKNEIKSILDIPCGDFYWIPLIGLDNISYFGADIVDDLIKLNEKKFKEPNLKFLKLDITKDELPEVDLIFSRDCLVHLDDKEIFSTISNIRKAKANYFATTIFEEQFDNNKSKLSDNWRPINLTKDPFNLGNPDFILDDSNNNQKDKRIAIWKISNI